MDESVVELNLERWDPRKLLRNRRAIAVGKPGTGKTVVLVDLMYYLRDMDDGIVLSPTDKFSGLWESFVPPVAVYSCYDKVAVQKVIARQEKLFNQKFHALLQEARQSGSTERVYKSDVTIPPVFIIADDCMADKTIATDPHITEIFMNGRHLQIFLLISAQWMMDMPMRKRQLVDYLFVCHEDNPQALRRLYDYFFSTYIPTYQAFQDIVSQITLNYGVLVLDRTNVISSRLEDHVFWWKADEHRPYSFRIGSNEWWQFNQAEFQHEYSEPRIQDRYFRRPPRNGPRVTVHRLPGRSS